MLDKMLEVAYRTEQKKTASRQLVDKLKELPLEELMSYVNGDPNCKLAYIGDCAKEGSGDFCWLDKYKGTPLFSKAVEIEKQLLQLDMEDQQQREAERAARPQPSEVWARRDALNLQKRMLDLDLVMAENGGAPAEPGPEAALEAAPEAPTAQEPKGQPAAAEAPQQGGEPSEEELAAALAQEAGGGGEEAPPQQQPPQSPKAKAPPQQGEEGAEEEDEEKAEKKDDKPKGMSVEVKQSSAATKVACAVEVGRFLAKTASGEAKLKREIVKKHPVLAKEAALPIGAIPGVLGAAAGADKGHVSGTPGTTALKGGIGAFGGAELGGQLGLMLGRENPAAGLAGAALGGLAGYKALTHKREKPTEKSAGMLGSLAAAAKPVMSQVGQVATGAKNLAQSAHAAGGMGQVASSFGNVAKNFAQKNPLAAAGIAGAGGMLAGKALSS